MFKLCFIMVFCMTALQGAPTSSEAPAAKHKTVCLNMIVKDESPVIVRALSSVKNLIDYWVIVDTGSTDGTQKIIQEYLKDIPGELHERPWVNFEHNRNEALALAKPKGDYLLFVDADEKLELPEKFALPVLDKDYYFAPVRDGQTDCLRVFMIKSALNWKWSGVLHEELICQEAATSDTFKDALVLACFADGHRTQDPQKYLKDAQLLEEALKKEPGNTRYAIFLALSYLAAKDYQTALKCFERRAAMGGREEEVFISLYHIACIKEMLNYPSEEIVSGYNKAYEYRQTRAEPLFRLGCYFYNTKKYTLGYVISKYAMGLPCPNDIVQVDRSVYDYKLRFLNANCAFHVKKPNETLSLYKEVLAMKNLPEAVVQEIQKNLQVVENTQKAVAPRS